VPPQNVVLLQGEKLTLFCNATGTPTLSYKWFKTGSGLVGNGKIYTISNILIQNEGTYQCTVIDGSPCTPASIRHSVTVNGKDIMHYMWE